MMIYPSIDELRTKVDNNKYTLCILAAKRSRDLIDGAPELLEEGKATSARKVSIASEEIEEGLIHFKSAEQVAAEKAEKEAALAAERAAREAEEAEVSMEDAIEATAAADSVAE